MKRLLVLLLALVLCFSLIPSALATFPSDFGQSISENSKIDVLKSLGIMDGDRSLNSPVTRMEAAAFISQTITGGNTPTAPATEQVFSDVPAGTAGSAAISTLQELHILSGDGDGFFRPTDKITASEFSVMLVRAAGIISEKLSFPSGFLSRAAELGLISATGVDPSAQVSVSAAGNSLFALLNAPLSSKWLAQLGAYANSGAANSTFLRATYGVEYTDGVLQDNTAKNPGLLLNGKPASLVNDVLYPVESAAADIGFPVRVYYKPATESGGAVRVIGLYRLFSNAADQSPEELPDGVKYCYVNYAAPSSEDPSVCLCTVWFTDGSNLTGYKVSTPKEGASALLGVHAYLGDSKGITFFSGTIADSQTAFGITKGTVTIKAKTPVVIGITGSGGSPVADSKTVIVTRLGLNTTTYTGVDNFPDWTFSWLSQTNAVFCVVENGVLSSILFINNEVAPYDGDAEPTSKPV